MMAPTTENGSSVTRLTITLARNAVLPYGSPVPTEFAATDKKFPHKRSTTGSPTSDHASQVRALLLIPPTLSAGVSPGSPLPLYVARNAGKEVRPILRDSPWPDRGRTYLTGGRPPGRV